MVTTATRNESAVRLGDSPTAQKRVADGLEYRANTTSGKAV